MASDYYTLLIDLSQRLSKDDLSNLVFSCGNIVPPSIAEKITTGIQLFQRLKQRGYLGPTNYDYLRKQLVQVGRHDLASMLPDQTEILFGRLSVRDKGYFGCFVSPIAPESTSDENSLVSASVLQFCHPNNESRVFLMCLSEQLSSEDAKKVAFLMYPTNGHVTAIDLAKLIERDGGLNSIDVANRLSSCLEAVGRIDLARLLNSLKASQDLLSLNSLSTSQQQLNLKMSLFIYSKQQSYDFYMKTLSEVENDDGVRKKLLSPLATKTRKLLFDPSKIILSAQNIKAALQNGTATGSMIHDSDSLIRTSLLEALKANQAYEKRLALLEDGEGLPLDILCDWREQTYESYKLFNSIMDNLNWNSAIRGELKENIDRHRSPFGTPAELACQYILDLCKEVNQCSDVCQAEMQKMDRHLLALNSDYFCCCYHVISLQWLASLLCLSTSLDGMRLDLSKYRETLWHIVQQKKDDIMKLYSHIAEIVGPDILQQLVPPPQSTGVPKASIHLSLNPFVLLFNVLSIKLLAVATFGPDNYSVDLSFLQMGQKFCNQVVCVASHMIRVSAAAMRKEVEAFRKRVLAEDRLCSRVITALTLESTK